MTEETQLHLPVGCVRQSNIPSESNSCERTEPIKDITDNEVQQISKNPDLMKLLNERKCDRARLSLEDVYQQLGLEDKIP
jgi:hypothetical protein